MCILNYSDPLIKRLSFVVIFVWPSFLNQYLPLALERLLEDDIVFESAFQVRLVESREVLQIPFVELK